VTWTFIGIRERGNYGIQEKGKDLNMKKLLTNIQIVNIILCIQP